MFYCIGENSNTSNSFGSGDSIFDAIISWGSEETKQQIFEEFEQYYPTIIEGKQLDVSVDISIAFTINMK